MANYGYVVIDDSGKQIKGTIESESEEKARKDLKNKGYMIMSLEEQTLLSQDISFDIGGKPAPRDLSIFCRQFVSMTRAGVNIIDTLRMLTEQTENKKLKEAIKQVRTSVEKGENLANSIAQHPKIFPELMVHMVAAGEASGSLDIALERLSTQFERSAKTQALVKKAMIYPIFVLVVSVVVVIAMLVLVIPTYMEMFDDLGAELPAITVMVMNASDFIQKWWMVLVPVIAVIAFGITAFVRTDTGKHLVDKAAIKIPVFADLTIKSASSHMARTMSTLMAAGVPIVEAADIVAHTMTNVWYKEALLEAKTQISVGVQLSVCLRTCGLFPPMVYHMTGIGEEVGNTEEMLSKLADYYDEEVEIATQALMSVMEPMMILVLAAIVGTLVGAVVAPMGSMYAALENL